MSEQKTASAPPAAAAGEWRPTDNQLWALWDRLPLKTPLTLARAALAASPSSPSLQPVQQADLHAQIMNLPCTVPAGYPFGSELCAGVYQRGHRDARHAAAELVSAASAAPQPAPPPVQAGTSTAPEVAKSAPTASGEGADEGFDEIDDWFKTLAKAERELRSPGAAAQVIESAHSKEPKGTGEDRP